MIGRLRGALAAIGTDWALIDVGGVGYEIHCGARLLANLPAIGEPVTLVVETHVREDMIRLYGFADEAERAWFRALQTVQGVGARIALAVIATLDANALANAVALQDKAQVSRAPGVGPKVAQRIVSELKDRMPAVSPAFRAIAGASPNGLAPEGAAAADAVSALTNLGYGPGEAAVAIAHAQGKSGAAARAEELIHLGLKELAQ